MRSEAAEGISGGWRAGEPKLPIEELRAQIK